MKTRLLIIVGIIAGILCSILFVAWSMASPSHNAFPEGYPRISQNDTYCWTQWWITDTELNDERMIASLGDAVARFGSDVDIPDRDISISHDTHIIISVAGIWTENQTQEQTLTSVIKDHIQDAEFVRDITVMCA